MNEDRARQMDIEAEETPRDEVEHEQIEARERIERNEQRTEERREAQVAEHRTPANTTESELEPLFEEEAARKFRSALAGDPEQICGRPARLRQTGR